MKMISKKIFAVLIVSALVLAVAINAQENTLIDNVTVILGDLTKILGSVGKILANPTVILNGELGENVGELVDRVVGLVADLGKTVNDLLLALGLATE